MFLNRARSHHSGSQRPYGLGLPSPDGRGLPRKRCSRITAAFLLLGLAACTLTEPAPESLSGADLHCPTGTKPCAAACVRIDQPSTGCESASCQPCAPAHASAACVNGACGVGACESEWSDCDRDPGNGCEEQYSTCDCHSAVFSTPTAQARIAHTGMDLGESDWTWELWLKRDSTDSRLVFDMNTVTHDPNYLFLDAGPETTCGVYVPGTQLNGENVLQDTALQPGAWQHLCCQRRGQVLQMFVNGYLKRTGTIHVPLHGTSDAALRHLSAGAALLGPTRLSRVARYEGEFVPRTRWLDDPDTVLLYLVKNGIDGTTISDEATDEAGGNNVGIILGGIEDGKGDTPCAAFAR